MEKELFANSQTDQLATLGERKEAWEQIAKEAEDEHGADHALTIAARGSAQPVQRDYEDYKVRTAETRARASKKA